MHGGRRVAGFDKPQRTRVLEREVQKGTHEKVQGGYGKYQGEFVTSCFGGLDGDGNGGRRREYRRVQRESARAAGRGAGSSRTRPIRSSSSRAATSLPAVLLRGVSPAPPSGSFRSHGVGECSKSAWGNSRGGRDDLARRVACASSRVKAFVPRPELFPTRSTHSKSSPRTSC